MENTTKDEEPSGPELKEYLKGYNHCEWVCQHMPDAVLGLEAQPGETLGYSQGFHDRQKEFERERVLTQIQERKKDGKNRGRGR